MFLHYSSAHFQLSCKLMETEEFDFFSSGSFRIHASHWIPSGGVQAILCIVHGLGEHINRYRLMAEYFSKNNIAVLGYDQRGHGKSEGKVGHAHYQELLDDLQELIINARKEYNDQPIFLFGQDLGGNLIANYLLKLVSSEITGAIISAGWFEPVIKPMGAGFKEQRAKVIGSLWPSFTLRNKIDPSDLAHDKNVMEQYVQDPLVHNKISIQLLNSLESTSKFAINNAPLIEIPLLVCHGEKDNITSMKASQDFANAIGASAEFKVWKGAKHEPHQDIDKEKVWEYYYKWVLDHIK